MKSRRFPSFLHIALCLLLVTLAAAAHASTVYLSDLPDFYQHQLSGSDMSAPFNRPSNFAGYTDPTVPSYSLVQPLDDGGPGIQWERNGGWCYITSFTDVFYRLDKNGAAGLFDHGGDHTWLERMNYAVGDFAIKAWGFGGNARESASQFIAGKIGAGRVAVDAYSWDAGVSRVMLNGEATPFTSMYSLYSYQLAMGNSAVLYMVNPGESNPDWWWNNSYHMVAGAGYNDELSGIYYADPNNSGADPAQANWGHPYGSDDSLPVGSSFYSFNTMDETGLLSGSGGYSGAQVSYVYVLSVVPEPSTSALAVLGGAISLCCWRRRGL